MTKYITQERARYWPISRKLMAQYNDGSHTEKNSYGGLDWWQNGQHYRDGDKPAYIRRDGSLEWYKNGKWNRDDDKPAWISASGTLTWWKNSLRHRICGPAVINPDGSLEWWINGKDITDKVNLWLDGEEWCGTAEQIVEFQLRFL